MEGLRLQIVRPRRRRWECHRHVSDLRVVAPVVAAQTARTARWCRKCRREDGDRISNVNCVIALLAIQVRHGNIIASCISKSRSLNAKNVAKPSPRRVIARSITSQRISTNAVTHVRTVIRCSTSPTAWDVIVITCISTCDLTHATNATHLTSKRHICWNIDSLFMVYHSLPNASPRSKPSQCTQAWFPFFNRLTTLTLALSSGNDRISFLERTMTRESESSTISQWRFCNCMGCIFPFFFVVVMKSGFATLCNLLCPPSLSKANVTYSCVFILLFLFCLAECMFIRLASMYRRAYFLETFFFHWVDHLLKTIFSLQSTYH